MVSIHDPVSCMWRCWDTGRKPWLSRLLLPISRMHWGYSCDPRNPIMAAPVAFLKIQWIPHKQQISESDAKWSWTVAQELWMDHSDTSQWSLLGLPRKSDRAISSTELTQDSLLWAASLSHWPALLARCLSQHKAVPVITDSRTNTLPWSQTVQSYHTPKFKFLHWEKIISGKHNAFHHAAVLILPG